MSKKEKDILENAPAGDKGSNETEKEKKPKKPKNTRKLKFGSMSVVTIVLVIAIVIVLNIMSGLLMKRYPVKLDLTPDNRYDISQQSIDVLADMDKDVEITVTSPKDFFSQMDTYFKNMYYQYYGVIVDVPYSMIPEVLEKYSVYAQQGKGSIKVSYVDINKNPDVVTELQKYYNGDIREGSIVFRCGDRVKVISDTEVNSMIVPSQNSSAGNFTMTFAGESIFTSAVRSVTDMKPVRAAIVSSMNGNAIVDQTHSPIVSSVSSFLASNGYDCTDVDVATDALSPEDYDLLVVAAPAIDFSQDIVEKFSDFLYNGGNYEKNMIYIPNLYASNLPNISEFLAEWKIEVETAYIVDESNSVQTLIAALGNVDYSPVLSIADSEAVGTLPNSALPIAAPAPKPVNVLSVNNDSVITEILKTSSSSPLEQLIQDHEVSSEPGEYNVIVKSRKETTTNNGFVILGSNLLVVGSPFMLDSAVLGSTNTFNNASAFLNIVNDMTGKEASAVIPEKALQQSNLALTVTSARVIQIVVIIAIPALVAVIGIAVLLWRKNK